MYAPWFAKRIKMCCTRPANRSTNPVHTPLQTTNKPSTNHCFKPLTKPCKPSSNPLCPLRGLHSLHLNKSKRGEYNRGLALQAYLLYKINGSACRSLPIKHTIKGFPRNITKHTKRNMLRHSTNPCGKPSFSSSPLRGTVGVNIIKSFRPSERLPLSPLHLLYPLHPPKPEQTSAGAKQKT